MIKRHTLLAFGFLLFGLAGFAQTVDAAPPVATSASLDFPPIEVGDTYDSTLVEPTPVIDLFDHFEVSDGVTCGFDCTYTSDPMSVPDFVKIDQGTTSGNGLNEGWFQPQDIDGGDTGTYLHPGTATFTVTATNADGSDSLEITVSITEAGGPTDIALTSQNVDENSGAGATVGGLSTTDGTSPYTYSLVAGFGDNGAFQINNTTEELETAQDFDFETKDSYSIRIETKDSAGLTYAKSFTISVTDVNDGPTDIALDSQDIDENSGTGAAVGTFSTTDEDGGDTFTYALVAGTGDTDNASFQINGD
ncbi:MAG: hypothetical protein WD356_10820, partial [Pseudomonadales bacterium]